MGGGEVEGKKKKSLYVNVEGSEKGVGLANEARFFIYFLFFIFIFILFISFSPFLFFFFFFFIVSFFFFFRDKGIEILEELESQGERLDKIEAYADQIDHNLKRGQRMLSGIESASGAGKIISGHLSCAHS